MAKYLISVKVNARTALTHDQDHMARIVREGLLEDQLVDEVEQAIETIPGVSVLGVGLERLDPWEGQWLGNSNSRNSNGSSESTDSNS